MKKTTAICSLLIATIFACNQQESRGQSREMLQSTNAELTNKVFYLEMELESLAKKVKKLTSRVEDLESK